MESVDKKVDKLLGSDFNAGTRCLQESISSNKEQDFFLKEAWRRFHTALTHETAERKAYAASKTFLLGRYSVQYNVQKKQSRGALCKD